MADMKALFIMIEDALVAMRDGHQDQTMKVDGQREEEEALIRAWAIRWMRVFQRKYAVEEGWIKEELAKPVPAP